MVAEWMCANGWAIAAGYMIWIAGVAIWMHVDAADDPEQ
jgi:hypothetical protein